MAITEEQNQETQNKINEILKKEWGSNANAQKNEDGHWYDVSSGKAVRIDNADGTYRLPDNRVLLTDGNIEDASEYQRKLNTPEVQSTEGKEGKELRQINRENRQATRQTRWNTKAKNLQDQYNELRGWSKGKLSYDDIDTYLRGEGIYAFQRANGLAGTGIINQKMIDKLEDEYLKTQSAERGNAMTNLFSDTRDENGRLKQGNPVATINGQEKSLQEAQSFGAEFKMIADELNLNGSDKFTPEARLRITELVEKYGLPVNENLGNAEEIFDSMDSLVEVLNRNGAESFLDASGFDIDTEGNVRLEKPTYNVQELLDAQRTKKKEEVDLELARKRAERQKKILAMQNIFANIGNTIRAAYGANVYDTSVAQQMNQIDNTYRDKVNAYKAKMEMLRQEKLAEQKAKEAEATRQRERAEDRKYQIDQFNAQLKFETDKLKLQYIMNNEELDAKQRIAAANRLSELTGKQDNIKALTLGGKFVTVDKDSYKNSIGQLASSTIGKFFDGTEELDLGLFKQYDPQNPNRTIEILANLIEIASSDTQNSTPWMYDPNTNTSRIKFKDGKTKEDVIEYFDGLLNNLAGIESGGSTGSFSGITIRPQQ